MIPATLRALPTRVGLGSGADRTRRLLPLVALAGLLLLTGCSAPGSVSLDIVESDADLAESHLTHSPTEATRDDDAEARRAVRAVTREEAVVVEDRRYQPIGTERPVRIDGVVYRLNATVVDSREVPRVEVGVDYDPADDAAGRTVQFDALPERDREVLATVIDPDYGRRTDGYEVNESLPYERPERSALLDGPLFVAYEGERYRVAATRRGTTTLEDFRYTAERVATTAAYGERVRQTHEFRLQGLDGNETAILESAREETYYPDSDDDAGFQALVDRFTARDEDAVRREESYGNWIVEWRGETYWVSLRFTGFETAA
ncbi:hypothetical protein RYH80_17005 [Halobaculum sp. MBLA0147]|uniref:hypothetical protein n=1 Tax=Halobaculum sp. MBLA0147 TaxID=3079934 RepID=UPI003525B19D